MSDISSQLIKDSYNYVLQSDVSTGNIYRIGGGIPVNPIFLSGLTVNGALIATSISATTITTPFSGGSVLFAGTSGQISQDNSQLFWDDTNNRLGIGTPTPGSKLTIIGNNNIQFAGVSLQNMPAYVGTNSDDNFYAYSSGQGSGKFSTLGPPNGTSISTNSGQIAFYTGNGSITERMRINSSTGNILIGTTTDSGNRLEVNGGTARFSGNVTLSSQLNLPGNNFSGTYKILVNSQPSSGDLVSGTRNCIQDQVNFFNPNSGSSTVYNSFVASPTINQTNGSSGTTRGLYVNPTITSAFDFRAIETVTGNVILGSTSGNTLIGTSVNSGFKLDVSGTTRIKATGALSTDICFSVRNSTDTRNFLVVNGAGDVFNNGAGGVTSNTFFGENSGRVTSGFNNSFFGVSAGQSNNLGQSNSFFGYVAGQNNTIGNFNSFFGLGAGQSNTGGGSNCFFGRISGWNNANGSNNSFFGTQSGRFLSDGISSLTTVDNSVFLGFDTRANGNGQTNQIVIGYQAIGLGSNTTVLGNSATTFTSIYGNTGIGTTTDAGYKLDVSGISRFRGTSTELYVNSNSTINGNGRFLVLNAYASSSPMGMLLSGGGAERARLVVDDGSGNLILQNTWNDYSIQFNTNGANERMRIVGSNGNVLIGTSVDAGYKLDVSGTSRTTTMTVTGLGTGIGILFGTNGTSGRITVDGTFSRWKSPGQQDMINVANNFVGITETSVISSAVFAIGSTTKGFLPPRMTTVQRDAISTPATGLTVYDTTTLIPSFYNGTNWQNVVIPNSSGNVVITGNTIISGGLTATTVSATTYQGVTRSFGVSFDGMGSVITVNSQSTLTIPYNMVIQSWVLLSDVTGSTVIDIWKDTYSIYPPTSGDSITSLAKPSIVSGIKNQSSTLTGWNTIVNSGDIIRFNVDSCTGMTKATLTIIGKEF